MFFNLFNFFSIWCVLKSMFFKFQTPQFHESRPGQLKNLFWYSSLWNMFFEISTSLISVTVAPNQNEGHLWFFYCPKYILYGFYQNVVLYCYIFHSYLILNKKCYYRLTSFALCSWNILSFRYAIRTKFFSFTVVTVYTRVQLTAREHEESPLRLTDSFADEVFFVTEILLGIIESH